MKRIAIFIVLNQGMHTIPCLYAIYCICIGAFDSSIPLSFTLALPFSTDTPLGWFLAWALGFNMAFVYGLTMVSITSYFVSCCTYMSAMCDHFNLLIDRSSEDALKFTSKKSLAEKQKLNRKISGNISEAVKIHVHVIEWVALAIDLCARKEFTFKIKFIF